MDQAGPGAGAFPKLVGVAPLLMNDGRAVLTVTLGPDHLNSDGVTHGGVVYTLADTAMSAALLTRLDPGERCVTLEIKVNYLAPVVTGTLTCDARLLDRTRRIAVLEARVSDGTGRLIAVGTGSFYVSTSKGASAAPSEPPPG